MNLKYGSIKSFCLFAGILCLTPLRPAHATSINNVSFSDTNITYETGGIPNGTTITFTLDSPGLTQVAVNCGIVNSGDTGTNVANLSLTTYAVAFRYPGESATREHARVSYRHAVALRRFVRTALHLESA